MQSSCHVIATARTKTDYAVTVENGRTKIEKLGTKTEQREGLDFEFTTVLRINQNHMFSASKDRTGLFDGKEAVFDESHGEMLIKWLGDGEDPVKLYSERISECQSLDELKRVWMVMPKSLQKDLDDVKNNKKDDLSSNHDEAA